MLKIRAFIIVTIIVLNIVLVSSSFGLIATDLDSDSNNTRNQSSDSRSRSNGIINWSQIEVISEPMFGQNINNVESSIPEIAVEGDKIYVVWNDINNTNNAGTDSDIFYRHFDGNSWSEIQVISEPKTGQNLNTGGSGWPSIAVENGKVYVVWGDNNDTNGSGTDEDIFFRCNLTGSNWEDIQVISEPVPGQNVNNGRSAYPKIEVENGDIYVVWIDGTNLSNAGDLYDIFCRCNLTGSNWESIQVISEPVFGQNINTLDSTTPDIAIENSNIYVVWMAENNTNNAGIDWDIFYRCNLTGTSWEDIQVLSEPVPGQNFNTAMSYYPSIAVESGKIYVAWDDYNNTNGAGTDGDIFYICNITGSSWEPVQVISEPVFGQNINTAGSGGATIIVKNDKIHVVWGDGNNTNGAGTDGDIFYRCNLTGISWEPVEVVSEPVFGQNLNTGGSGTGGSLIDVDNDKLHVVWVDENNTNGAGTDVDIFYRWKYIVSPSLFLISPKVSPVSGNTSTEFNFTVTYIQLNNTPPTRMKVIIDGIDHPMLGFDPIDNNYTNGKKYFFKSNNLEIGIHTYKFNASDGLNFTDTKPIRNFIVRNSLPRILTENNLTAVADECYEVIYEFEDCDIATVNQKCNWEFSTNASWLDFDTSTTKLYGTPTNGDVGRYWVNISVFDSIDIADNNFTLEVIDINYAPIIYTNNRELAKEDELYEIDYDASDIDSPINFQIWSIETNTSNWLGIDESSGILKGIPENDDVGIYWVNVTVNDGAGGKDWANFTLTVIDTNDVPIITTENKTITFEDDLYSVNYTAIDIDDPTIFEWVLNTNASWLGFYKKTGILFGTPKNDDVGKYYVNITVVDVRNGKTSQNFTLEVVNVNDPPEWVNVPIDTKVSEGDIFEFDVDAIDIDLGDKLEYYMTFRPETNITIDPRTGMIRWSANIENLSAPDYELEIVVYATDGIELISTSFYISVIQNPRSTSQLISPANNTIVSAKGAELKWAGYDEYGDSLTYDVYLSYDKTLLIDFEESSRIFRKIKETTCFVEDLKPGGKYYWTVIPHDGLRYGICIDNKFEFVVNTPPKLAAISLQNAQVGQEFRLEIKASDTILEHVENFQFGVGAGPEGLAIEPSTGLVTWTPTKKQIGQHSINVWVSDGIDQTNITFEIEVHEEVKPQSSNPTFMIITSLLIVIIIIINAGVLSTEVGKYKFFSLVFVPLYNKLNPNKIMDNFMRGKIIGYIQSKPGDHYNAIKYSLKLKNGTFAHHTKVLEKEGLIRIQRDGFYTRFYPQGALISESKSPPLKEVQEELLDVIRHEPGITQHEIIELLKLSQRIISYNLLQLKRANLIITEPQGREIRYYVNEIEADSIQPQDQISSPEKTQDMIEPMEEQETFSASTQTLRLPPARPEVDLSTDLSTESELDTKN